MVVRRGYPRGRIQLPETEFLGYEDAVVPYNAKYFDDKTTPNVIEKLIYIDPDRSTASSDSLAFKTVAGATDASFINTLDDSKHVETSQYVIPRSESYTTFRSIKAMARFSFDLGLLFGMEEQSFKFFGELGVLGILNQDYYYEKITDRIPLMLGVDIPTWGIFDIFSFQLEYFKSPHNNSMAIYRYGLSKNPVKDGSAIANAPVPGRPSFGSVISGYDDAGVTEIFYDNPSTDDDIKWTVFIKKTLTPGISLYCQAASDHMRTFSFEWAESYSPIYKSPGDWYFLFRLEYGI